MRSEGWKEHECYAAHGVDGTDCSYLAYLGQIENFCPVFDEPSPSPSPGQSKPEQIITSPALPHVLTQALSGSAAGSGSGSGTGALDDLLERVLQDPRWSGRRTLDWVRARIRTMWPHWETAGRTLLENNPFASQQLREGSGRQRILLHLGVLTRAAGTSFAESASRGGPLGELVQWSDLIASLHALGHELVVTTELEDLLLAMTPLLLTLEPCQDAHNRQSEREGGFDLIFSDILGYLQLRRLPNFSHHVLKCRMRVLDSFGTEAKFDVSEYVAAHQELRTAWGRLDLNPRQFLTMFPHTPDNSFLGVVVNPVVGANSSRLVGYRHVSHSNFVTVGSARLRVEVTSRRDRLSSSARPRALIYGKSLEAWSGAGASELLEFLHEEMGLELHATIAVPPLAQPSQPVPVAVAPPSSASSSFAGARPRVPMATNVSDGAAAGAGASPSRSQSGSGTPGSPAAGPLAALPAFVHNHGLLPLAELHALYRSVVFFIGMGFPFEGPAPLEAIANGAVFINPRFPVPLSSKNHAFFRGKPTHRTLSSQHPYLEEWVGLPHVHTIDIRNGEEIRETLSRILEAPQPKPRVPFEMSAAGFMERVFYQLRHGDECRRGSGPGSVPEWPPSSAVRVFLAPPGQSCAAACARAGRVCELSYLSALNSAHELRIHGIACDQVAHENEPFLPAFDASARKCILMNSLPLLHSCADAHSHLQRICPCRDFIPSQTALCSQCRY